MIPERELTTTRGMLRTILTEMSRRLSWRAAALLIVGPILATICLLLGVGSLLAVAKALTSADFNPAVLPTTWLHADPAVLLHGKTFSLDPGLYYAWGALVFPLMLTWILVVPRPELPPIRRLNTGLLTGMCLSGLLVFLLCMALGAGLPDY